MKSFGAVASYWKIVQETLVQLFHFNRAEARQKIADLRLRLDAAGTNTKSTKAFFYHAEPLYVATDLAAQSHLKEHVKPELEQEYDLIRKRVLQGRQSKKIVRAVAPEAPSQLLVSSR